MDNLNLLVLAVEPVDRRGKMLAQHHRFQNELDRLFERDVAERRQPFAQMKERELRSPAN
jgi:heme exporter protein D